MGEQVDVARLVGEFQAAVRSVQDKVFELGLRVSGVELEIQVAMEKTAGAGFKLWVVSVDMDVTSMAVSTISVAFKPDEAKSLLEIPYQRELAEGLMTIEQAMRSATDYGLTEGAIELGFTTTAEGKIELGARAGGSLASGHSAKLTVEPRT